MKISVVGFAWYKPEDYQRLLNIFSDSHLLAPNYEDWLQKAEYGVKDFESKGYRVVKAYIDPDTFPEWCRSRGLDVDAKGRMAYGNFIAHRSHGGQN